MVSTGLQFSSIIHESGLCPRVQSNISFVADNGVRNKVYPNGIAAIFQV